MSIHKPATRLEFKEWVLRSLGKGAVVINVTDFQVEDAIESALSYYKDFHMNGTYEDLYKHQVDTTDVGHGYLTLPNTVYGIREVLDVGEAVFPTSGWLSPQYQLFWSEINSLQTMDMVPYVMARQHIELINQVLGGTPLVRFTNKVGKLFIDTDWNKLNGRWLLIDAYIITDPALFPEVWQDRWLQQYAMAQVKFRWGSNLGKHMNVQMLDGLTFNGQQIMDDANTRIEKLEVECQNKYSLPPQFFIG